MKSYRKLAVQWHPDHYEGDDKKKAEKMFIDIAAAKEVLTDPGTKSYCASNFAKNKNKNPFLGCMTCPREFIEPVVL